MPFKMVYNDLTDLTKLCRVCFEYGAVYLDTYKVREKEVGNEISAEEMLKIFTLFTVRNMFIC